MRTPLVSRRLLQQLTCIVGALATLSCSGSEKATQPRVTAQLMVSSTAETFDESAPATRSIDITSSASGSPLTGLTVAVTFPSGQSGRWLSATLNGTSTPATLTIQAFRFGLAPGDYEATIVISAAGLVASRSVTASMHVALPALPAIGLSAPSVSFAASPGGSVLPALLDVSVSNTGTGTLAGLSASVTYSAGQPSGWLVAGVTSANAPAWVHIQPSAAGLSSGTYDAVVTVRSSVASVAARDISVRLVVSASPLIAVYTQAMTFATIKSGPNPAEQSVYVVSGGGTSLATVSARITHQAGEPSGWLSITGNGTLPELRLVRATTGSLNVGEYHAVIELTSAAAANSPQKIFVTFRVREPSTPLIALETGSVVFDATTCAANPAPRSIAVTNAGGGSLTGLSAAVALTPVSWLSATLAAPVAPTSLLLTPTIAALTPGTHETGVRVASPVAAEPAVFLSAQIRVARRAEVVVSPSTLSFTAVTGGSNPTPQRVDITDGCPLAGGLPGLATRIAYESGQPTGWLSASMGPGAAPSVIIVPPTTGTLPAGTYRGSIIISSTAPYAVPATIPVTFTVTASAATHALTTNISPAGVGVVTRSPNQASYASGTSVTLEATALPGWKFSGWSGAVTSSANPVTLTMTAPKTVTATFGLVPPKLAEPTAASGGVLVAWTYDWPCGGAGCLGSSNDFIDIEESTTSSTSGFVSVQHTQTLDQLLTRGAGTYHYRVRATTRYGTTPYSAVRSITLTQAVPAAPTSLVGTVAGTRVSLSWTNPATNEIGTRIESCTGASCTNFVQIASLGANATTYQASRLTPGATLRFRVRNYNDAGPSGYSNVVAAVIPQSSSTIEFINNAKWSIVSLKVNNTELITTPGTGIATGSSHVLSLTPGTYTYRVGTGFWDGNSLMEMYFLSGTLTLAQGGALTVTIVDPTIAQLLTNFGASRLWDGEYFDENYVLHSSGFRFRSDGTCTHYIDGLQPTACTFSLVDYTTGLISFRVRFANNVTFDGLLDEFFGYFMMNNGPTSFRTIKYVNSGQP